METVNTILSIVQVIIALAVVVLILMQQSKHAGMSGVIGGGAETFFGKNKASGLESTLNRLTIVLSIVLCLLTLVLNIVK